MLFRSLLLLFWLVAAAISVAPRAVAADDQADALFRKGREAAARKDWTAARAAYARAWSIKQSYDIAANLGQAEYKLGLYRDAAEHLDHALRHFPAATEAEEARTRIREALADAKAQIVTVRVAIDQPHASVSVDGKPVGQSPLPGELYVEPGTHSIEAQLAGYRPAQADVAASAGEELSVQLSLLPEAPAAQVAPPSPPAPAPAAPPPAATAPVLPPPRLVPVSEPAPKRSLLPVFIGAGVTAAALAGGIVLSVQSSRKSDEADTLREEIAVSTHRCDDRPVPTKCGDLRDTLESKDTLRNWSTVAFIGAGVAATATVVYLLWPGPSSTRVGFGAAPGSAAVSLSSVF